MCTWAVSAVIDYYNRQGTALYGCAMDLSKTFDLVEWVTLFKTLQSRQVSPVFLRTLLFVYTAQSCDVKWNGSYSFRFPVTNGVRQGAVSSPTIFSVGLKSMVKIAEDFAKSRSLRFSTNPDPKKSKTKCLVFSKLARARQDILPILLNGVPLPCVDKLATNLNQITA
jgi:hypothetical protein